MIIDGDFKNIIPRAMKLPKIDAIRDALKYNRGSALPDVYSIKYKVNCIAREGTLGCVTVVLSQKN
jgi:hypothetical protein